MKNHFLQLLFLDGRHFSGNISRMVPAMAAILLSLVSVSCSGPSSGTATSGNDLPVKVEPALIHDLGNEHFGNAVFRHGRKSFRIAASGNRILEFPVQVNAPVTEVVPAGSGRYNNGACAFDINGDGIDEMIVGRNNKEEGTDLLWFEEVPGNTLWNEHLIASVKSEKGDAEKGFHDIMPFETRVSGSVVRGVAVVASRKRLFWYQIPDDPTQLWIEHKIADLTRHEAEHAQSGLAAGDITANGCQDLVCGNFWAECPENPLTGKWIINRYSNWDRKRIPAYPGVPEWVMNERFGGMNQLDLGDLDGDGKIDIVASEAEIPDARLGVFCRDKGNPRTLWKETVIDTSIYCPHSLVVTDVNNDMRPDILVGEMTAGGWYFPRNSSPHLYLYLNLGNLKFRKYILHTGWGIHMMRKAELPEDESVFVFAADEIQPWYEDMTTLLVGWKITAQD